eukprot:403376284
MYNNQMMNGGNQYDSNIQAPNFQEYQLALQKWKGKNNNGTLNQSHLPTIRKSEINRKTLLDYPDDLNLSMKSKMVQPKFIVEAVKQPMIYNPSSDPYLKKFFARTKANQQRKVTQKQSSKQYYRKTHIVENIPIDKRRGMILKCLLKDARREYIQSLKQQAQGAIQPNYSNQQNPNMFNRQGVSRNMQSPQTQSYNQFQQTPYSNQIYYQQPLNQSFDMYQSHQNIRPQSLLQQQQQYQTQQTDHINYLNNSMNAVDQMYDNNEQTYIDEDQYIDEGMMYNQPRSQSQMMVQQSSGMPQHSRLSSQNSLLRSKLYPQNLVAKNQSRKNLLGQSMGVFPSQGGMARNPSTDSFFNFGVGHNDSFMDAIDAGAIDPFVDTSNLLFNDPPLISDLQSQSMLRPISKQDLFDTFKSFKQYLDQTNPTQIQHVPVPVPVYLPPEPQQQQNLTRAVSISKIPFHRLNTRQTDNYHQNHSGSFATQANSGFTLQHERNQIPQQLRHKGNFNENTLALEGMGEPIEYSDNEDSFQKRYHAGPILDAQRYLKRVTVTFRGLIKDKYWQ